MACSFGLETLVKKFIDSGFDVDDATRGGSTPLHYAAARGHTSICRRLINAGADRSVVDNAKVAALHYAINNGHKETIEYLLDTEI